MAGSYEENRLKEGKATTKRKKFLNSAMKIPFRSCFQLLLGFVLCCSHVHSLNDIRPIPANGIHVIQSERIIVDANSADNPITIQADVPVSALRYSDSAFLDGGQPIGNRDMLVVVTSDCDASELTHVPQIEYGYSDTSVWVEGGATAYPVTSVSVRMVEVSNTIFNNTNTSFYNESGMSVGDAATQENFAAQDLDDLSFLPTSSFGATWAYTSGQCLYYTENEHLFTKNGNSGAETKFKPLESYAISSFRQGSCLALTLAVGITGLFLSTSIPMLSRGSSRTIFATVTLSIALMTITVYGLVEKQEGDLMGWDGIAEESVGSERYLQEAQLPKMCKVNVEILHDGCRFNPLQITAPTVRNIDVLLQDQERDNENCTTTYYANLTFPESSEEIFSDQTTAVSRTVRTTTVPQLEYWQYCNRPVEGRPFIDLNGSPLQASSTRSTAQKNGWSTPSSSFSTNASDTNSEPRTLYTEDKAGSIQFRDALATEWTRRALAEHASISSFAAFTIALMSNNAPPDLVQDSLTAASDEVRHAKVSFEVASYFSKVTVVEPGPLPQSSHRFEQNETALAMATAREGCVDETLSALVAALEVDEQLNHPEKMKWLTKEEQDWLKDTVRTIAIEEAAHSALAWRTIHWICRSDRIACESVREKVLEPVRLEKALELRMQGRPESLETLKDAWSSIYEVLMPFAVEGEKPDLVSLLEFLDMGEDDADSNIPLTKLISRMIIRGVVQSSRDLAKE